MVKIIYIILQKPLDKRVELCYNDGTEYGIARNALHVKMIYIAQKGVSAMVQAMIVWGIIFAAAVVAEIVTFQLVTIWFAAGALGAFIAAALGAPVYVQAIIFTVLSALLLVVTRPILKNLKVRNVLPTNADGEVGKLAVVTEDIDNTGDTGRVKIGGVNWRARSSADEHIEKGTSVRVTAIEGTTAFVVKETP